MLIFLWQHNKWPALCNLWGSMGASHADRRYKLLLPSILSFYTNYKLHSGKRKVRSHIILSPRYREKVFYYTSFSNSFTFRSLLLGVLGALGLLPLICNTITQIKYTSTFQKLVKPKIFLVKEKVTSSKTNKQNKTKNKKQTKQNKTKIILLHLPSAGLL